MSPTPPDAGGFDTYEKLQELIANYLGRGDLGERIPDFIHLVEVDISRSLNLREQEKDVQGTLVVDQDYINMPDDLQIPRLFRIDADPVRMIEIVSMTQFTMVRETFDAVPDPMVATMVGDRFYIAPAPSAADPYTLFYRARLLPLSSSNSTNRILKDAPDCLLYGSLMHSAPYIGDDQRIQLWGTLYGQAKEDYKRFEWRARTYGGGLRVRADNSPDDVHNIGGS